MAERKEEKPVISKKGWKASDYQAQQLQKLLKDPNKAVFIPAPPSEKRISAPQDMMKNVQGSSAGAGSGEFHIYKQSRRREFERLAEMDRDEARAEAERYSKEKTAEVQAALDAKTAKNRAKRLRKKKNRGKGKDKESDEEEAAEDGPVKKRRLLGGEGKEIKFGLAAHDDEEEDSARTQTEAEVEAQQVALASSNNIVIVDND